MSARFFLKKKKVTFLIRSGQNVRSIIFRCLTTVRISNESFDRRQLTGRHETQFRWTNDFVFLFSMSHGNGIFYLFAIFSFGFLRLNIFFFFFFTRQVPTIRPVLLFARIIVINKSKTRPKRPKRFGRYSTGTVCVEISRTNPRDVKILIENLTPRPRAQRFDVARTGAGRGHVRNSRSFGRLNQRLPEKRSKLRKKKIYTPNTKISNNKFGIRG